MIKAFFISILLYQIIPGVGFKDLRLGDNIYKAYIVFGKPEKKLGTTFGTIYYYKKGIYINFENDKITHFGIILTPKENQKYSPFQGETKEGIGKDSKKDDIIKKYGSNYRFTKGFKGISDYMLIYDDYGIGFFLDKKGNIERIIIFKPYHGEEDGT